jgi:hypothetical protein
MLYRVFVIWNPPLKHGSNTAAKVEDDGKLNGGNGAIVKTETMPIVTGSTGIEPTATESIQIRFIATEDTATGPMVESSLLVAKRDDGTSSSSTSQISEKIEREDEKSEGLSRFLDGCEDRPPSLGESGSDCVGYHRGWKRKKNKGIIPIDEQTKVEIKDSLGIKLEKETPLGPARDRDRDRSQDRMSSITQMSTLLSTLVRLRVRTLAFCGVRKLVELVLAYCLKDLGSSSSSAHLAQCVGSYRGDCIQNRFFIAIKNLIEE